MAVDAVRPTGGAGLMTRMSTGIQNLPTLYRAIVAEMRRVTWPTREETRRMSIGVIALSLAIGGAIAIIDFILTQVLVKWIPSIFAR